MANVTSETEDVSLAADEVSYGRGIATVPFDDLNIVPNGIDVEIIGSARWIKRVEDCDGSSRLNKPNCEITSYKSEAAGDQYFLAAILIHTGNLRARTRFHQIFNRPRRV